MEAFVLVLKAGDCLLKKNLGRLLGLKHLLTDCMVFTNLLKYLVVFCIHYYLHEV